ETRWRGKLSLSGNRFTRFEAVNFLNPELPLSETAPNTAACFYVGGDWQSRGRRSDEKAAFDGGGLCRLLRVYRLPEAEWSRHLAIEHAMAFPGGADLPVYVRVTQADGHQAW